MEEKRPEVDDVVPKEYEHSDSDTLSIKDAARGDNLPDNYFMSFSFIGTLLVRVNKTSSVQSLTISRVFA